LCVRVRVHVCLVMYIHCVKCGYYLKSNYFHYLWRRHAIPLVESHFRFCRIKKKANCPDTLFPRIFFFKKSPSRDFPQLLTFRLYLIRKCVGSFAETQPLNCYAIKLLYFTMRIGVTEKLQ